MATINIVGTGGIIEGNLGTANVNVNLDGVLSFDNVSANNDRVVIADDDAATTGDFGTGAFSISFWFYHAEGGFSGDTWGGVITKGYTTSAPANTWGIVRRATNTSQIVYQQATDAGGGYSDTLYGPSGVEGHGWKHYVITRSGTDTKMYVDGILFDDNTASETSNLSNSSNLQFGTWNETEDFGPFYLADVKFFTDAITADEVKFLASKIQADPDVGGLDNCVSWWKLNEGTGTNAANSISAGDNGTITGAEWVYDAFSVDVYDNSTTTDGTFTVTQGKVEGKALTSVDLDGSNDYISLGTGLTTFDGATEGTFSAWVKRDGTGSEDSIISHYDSTDSNRQFNFLVNASNQAKLVIQNDKANFNSAHDVAGTTSFASGVWYHMVGTFSTTNGQKIYVNGVLEGTAATTIEDALDTVTTDANIGVLEQGGSLQAHTNGNVKDVRLYTQELSADQVASLYSNTLPITPTNWWKIDDATQTATATIEDYGTGTDVDGTGVSLTWTNGTLDLDGALTIDANGTLSMPRGELELSGNLDINCTTVADQFIHNNGTLSVIPVGTSINLYTGGATFYNVHRTSGDNEWVYQKENCTILKRLYANDYVAWGVADASTLTLGDSDTQCTVDGSQYIQITAANGKIYGGDVLKPALIQCTSGLQFGANTNLKWLDIQVTEATGGGGHTITLDGDMEFDALTVSSGDTLDLNGNRAEFGGDVTYQGTWDADGLAVFHGGFTKYGTLNNAASGDIMVVGTSGFPTFSYITGYRTFFTNGGVQLGTGGFTNISKAIIGSGELKTGTRDTTATDFTLATGAEFEASDNTLTVSGDLTMSGGLLGASALETVASSSESASTSANYTVLDNLASCTIEFWLKLTDISNTSARILNVNSGTSGEAYYIRTDGSALQFHLGCLTTDANFSNSDTSLLTLSNVGTKWHHYALVKDNNTVSLYIDGKKVAEKTTSGNTQSANSALVIGKYHGASSNYADMVMDELRFYTDVRTTSEIRDNMFTESPSGDALVGHYKFDEGTGTTVADSSSNSNTLTLSDAGAWAAAGTYDKTNEPAIVMAGTTQDITCKNGLDIYDLTINDGSTTSIHTIDNSAGRLDVYGNLTVNEKLTSSASSNTSGITMKTAAKTLTVASDVKTTALATLYQVVLDHGGTTEIGEMNLKLVELQSGATLKATGDFTVTTELEVGGACALNANGKTLTCKLLDMNGTSTLGLENSTLILSSTDGLTTTSNTILNGGPGTTVSGSSAATTFESQNNFAIVGKAENLNVTNEELKVTGQVINCTGDIHQYFPTIDHNQQLDADTADDRDVRLGRDLDSNTELINS